MVSYYRVQVPSAALVKSEEHHEKEEKSYENNFYCAYRSAYIAAYHIHQSSSPFKRGS